jgi:hypothetical protein
MIIRLPTAVPKMLAASFDPNDQPRKSPLERKTRTMASMVYGPCYVGFKGRA